MRAVDWRSTASGLPGWTSGIAVDFTYIADVTVVDFAVAAFTVVDFAVVDFEAMDYDD